MRRRGPSTATVIALAALIVALGGTAVAASRYIITSTSQIKPSVLREIREGRPRAKAAALAKEGVHAVRARARLAAPIVSQTSVAPVPPVSLTGGTWAQGSEEVNRLIGIVVVTPPRRTECGPGGGNMAFVNLYVDNEVVGVAEEGTDPVTGSPEPQVVRVHWLTGANLNGQEIVNSELFSDGLIFATGAKATHMLSVESRDRCGEGGTASGGHFTIDSVTVDVLGFK